MPVGVAYHATLVNGQYENNQKRRNTKSNHYNQKCIGRLQKI